MKLETSSRLTCHVQIPQGVHLSVPAMGTSPDRMIVTVVGPTEGECLRKLDGFLSNFIAAAATEEER